jgi:short-subunit dehydrogenase
MDKRQNEQKETALVTGASTGIGLELKQQRHNSKPSTAFV